jgi:hypothetical protein
MFTNKQVRVEFTNEQNNEADAESNHEVGPLGRAGMELESRITPLVAIEILAVMICWLLPLV